MATEQRFTKPGTTLNDLEIAWFDRLTDADALMTSGRHASAIVMGLFSLEILLKVFICRKLAIKHLPRAFEIHDLDGLLLLSGLSSRINEKTEFPVRANWSFLVRSSERLNEMRYSANSGWSQNDAVEFFDQLRGEPNGVLTWLLRQQ